MITATASPVKTTGTLHGEKVAMGFDPNSLPFLQQILSGQYGDDELACLREYTCNGRDATIEAGSTRPVEVTLPNLMSPFLKIRDYGVGLDVDSIRTIFSQYGASTKRDTDDQTGCLGIGSKSALAYTSSFNVTSVKNGQRVQLAIGLNDLGAGEITIIEQGTPTTEPNGTEVSIPAKRHHTFENKARRLFQYWPKGSVLINGREPDPVPEALSLSDKTATIRVQTPEGHRDVRIDRMIVRDGDRQSVIVMGGVPYPIPDDMDTLRLPNGKSVVVWVAMGEINFAPSREAVRKTLRTQQAIEAIHLHFEAQAQKAVQKSINEAKTPGDALRLMIKWKSLMPEHIFAHKYTFNGLEIPLTFKLSQTDGERGVVVERNAYKLNACSRQASVMADTGIRAVWFFNYDKDSFTAGQKKKINFWADQQPWSSYPYDGRPDHYILVKGKPDATFLDSSRVFDWMTTIDPIRVPRSGGGGSYGPTGRIPGSYDFYEGVDFREGVPGDEIDTDSPVYYYVRDRWSDRWSALQYIEKVEHFEPGSTTVILTSNRVEKFKRLFPQTESIQSRARTLTNEWLETVDDNTKALLGFKAKVDTEKFKALTNYHIADPEIAQTITDLRRLESDKNLTKVEEEAKVLGVSDFSGHSKWIDPLTKKKYPLAFTYWGGFNTDKLDHVVAYLNAAHAL